MLLFKYRINLVRIVNLKANKSIKEDIIIVILPVDHEKKLLKL